MSRRSKPSKRALIPDVKYNSQVITMFVNRLMHSGKKSVALGVIYDALALAEERAKRPAMEVFDQALKNVGPTVEVKPRRVGGATYQVPMEVPTDRRQSLAMRWIIAGAKGRGGRSMAERLAGEFLDAANNTGGAVKKKEETHKIAEANRAFAHYRW
ncbi:MAG TPA: 30S ribosomal protein S7 [Anaerolineales bacterium]|nr:30S ribosomal protein S7 [Anaerolineales bacterium]HLF03006.1 30S ribosomal protein S7 [Anaerolineales bacterium]